MSLDKLPKLTYSEIYADALSRDKHETEDLRREILEHYENLREQMKILEIYLHALGDAGLARR